MILGMHHTAIATRDLARLKDFYCDLFGMTPIVEDEWSDAPELDVIVGLEGSAASFALLKAGNQCLELFEYSAPQPRASDPNRPVCDAGITHICFGVTDLDAEYERLSAAGMTFNGVPQRAGDRPLRAIYGRDPDGNVVELLEVTGEHPFNYRPTTPSWVPHLDAK